MFLFCLWFCILSFWLIPLSFLSNGIVEQAGPTAATSIRRRGRGPELGWNQLPTQGHTDAVMFWIVGIHSRTDRQLGVGSQLDPLSRSGQPLAPCSVLHRVLFWQSSEPVRVGETLGFFTEQLDLSPGARPNPGRPRFPTT